jgi:hypothetical protein
MAQMQRSVSADHFGLPAFVGAELQAFDRV